jgi:protein involved in temperature-dependent protein secretion
MNQQAQESIAADLDTAQKSMAEAMLKLQEFNLACQHGEWDRAERVRLEVVAHMEAHLDAYARACRRLQLANR